MSRFDLGQRKEALESLRSQVLACQDSDQQCSQRELATLFVCVAIVLATEGDHNGSVQAFKKATSHDSRIGVANEYRTAPVLAAYREAHGQPQAPRPRATPRPRIAPSGPPPQAIPLDDDGTLGSQPDKGLVLLTVTGKAGAVWDSFGDAVGITHPGVGLTLAGNPSEESGFAIGARLRGGGYTVPDDSTVGYLGGNLLLGSIVGRRKENHFGYFFGGGGIQTFPSAEVSMATFQFVGGASIGGFAIGGGVDIGINRFNNVVTLGVELGWGAQLAKR